MPCLFNLSREHSPAAKAGRVAGPGPEMFAATRRSCLYWESIVMVILPGSALLYVVTTECRMRFADGCDVLYDTTSVIAAMLTQST